MNAPLPVVFPRMIAVCVVDDDILRGVVCEALESAGFVALQGVDGSDGLDLLHAHERVHVIVLEQGRDAAAFRAVQRFDPAHRHAPVVVITAHAADATAALRPALVLRKPLSIENLIEGVRLLALRSPPPHAPRMLAAAPLRGTAPGAKTSAPRCSPA